MPRCDRKMAPKVVGPERELDHHQRGEQRIDTRDEETAALVRRYVERLNLSAVSCLVTTDRSVFATWLGRPVPSAYGGAYVYDSRHDVHLVLINLARIDRSRPRAVEVVVAEELLHLRDHLDGDRRRHAKHGHDRIAKRVSELTGASLVDIRSVLLPTGTRPYRYVARCPRCSWEVLRKKRGRWACPRCWSTRHATVPLALLPLDVSSRPA